MSLMPEFADRFTPVGTGVAGVLLALFGNRAVMGYWQNGLNSKL